MWIIRDITERVRAEEALTAANLALEESNRDLETHVAARTSALQQTKSQLEVQLRQKEMLLEELRRGEARLIERTRELARSNEDLQEFAYAASHDLKEPLRGIGNFARMLREDEHGLAPQSLERLHTIERLAERLHTLLDSLLEYSRAGRLALALEPTDLTGVAREAADALAPWLAERGGTVSIGALPAALCDRQRIAGVLASLIVNGVQYNLSESKRVAISGQRSGDLVRVTVADNGIGIGPRHFDAVFKMFRRLHPQNRFGGGSGAGLATARKIVERHGGQITVQSAPGEGSAFTFTLPAAGSGPA
jgi:light-regulated signal transduction histidine kinase (bacteriophytochrome)